MLPGGVNPVVDDGTVSPRYQNSKIGRKKEKKKMGRNKQKRTVADPSPVGGIKDRWISAVWPPERLILRLFLLINDDVLAVVVLLFDLNWEWVRTFRAWGRELLNVRRPKLVDFGLVDFSHPKHGERLRLRSEAQRKQSERASETLSWQRGTRGNRVPRRQRS